MTKDKLNAKLREYSKSLSPTLDERDLVGRIYQSFNDLLGVNNCIQIGSYPRFTSVTPIHDLDILYFLGAWNEADHTPATALQSLVKLIETEYKNPTSYATKVSLQTHSVTIAYSEHGAEKFSVDIVPGYTHGKNEFGDDTYKVPEVLKVGNHQKRQEFYKAAKSMDWIKSDPRGYISVATKVGANTDFRKTVKFVKKWKHHLSEFSKGTLKLKSFHIEQIITAYFKANPDMQIFDAVFKFFIELSNVIDNPNKIADRANADKFIDDYVAKFTQAEKDKIRQARDAFLTILEGLDESDSPDDLMDIYFHDRHGSEEFLFDSKIPVLKEQTIAINGWIQKDGKDERRLSAQGVVDNGYYIRFEVFMPVAADHYRWKVKNDNASDQPRGEITMYRTKNIPERTQYRGRHYVECYAIKGGVCVAVARQDVWLQ